MIRGGFRTLAAVVALMPAIAHAEPTVAPIAAEPMALTGSFAFTSEAGKAKKQAKQIAKLRKSVSGIACAEGRCLLAFDEGVEARFATLTESAYVADPAPVPLIRAEENAATARKPEADAEAVAADRGAFYVAGSYAAKRSDGDANPVSRRIVRLDRRGGAPEIGDVAPAIKSLPLLAEALGRPLDKGAGLNVEGLAVKDSRLWFGLRGPAANGVAHVLRIDAGAPFETPAAAGGATLLDIADGDGRGVRDMQAVDGGFLILAGPDDDPDHAKIPWRVLLWDGSSPAAKPLALLDLSGVTRRTDLDGCDDEPSPKPEALLATRQDAQGFRIAVLSDGLCDGGPLWFEIPRN